MGMSRRRLVWDGDLGKFVPGRASPWQPPEQLRGLPSSWVTKDTSDPDKIHELDAPHIVQALIHEQQKQEQAVHKDAIENAFKEIDVWSGPFDQRHIDWIRFKAIRNIIRTAMVFRERGAIYPLRRARHLWFPCARLDPRELRDGRPPLSRDRPRHLRDKDLVVDVYAWPERVMDELRRRGIEAPNVEELESAMARKVITLR